MPRFLVRRELLFILRICEQNSSAIIRFEILYGFQGANVSGPLRNGRVPGFLKVNIDTVIRVLFK